MANYCAIIPSVLDNSGKLVDSKLFTDLLVLNNNDRINTKNMYLATRSSTFINQFGDWEKAKKDFLAKKYNTIDEALRANKVQGKVDTNFEPLLVGNHFELEDGTIVRINSKVRKNTISNYVSVNPDLKQTEKDLLRIHREAINSLYSIKEKGDKLKEAKSTRVKELYDAGTYSDTHPDLVSLNTQIANNLKEYQSYQNLIPDLSKLSVLDNRDMYNKLVANMVTIIKNKPGYDLKNDIKSLSDDYRLLKMIQSMGELVEDGIRNEALQVESKLMTDIEEYVKSLTPYLNLDNADFDQLSKDILTKPEKDVNILEYWFNGFGDYPRLEAQLIHTKVLKGKALARTRAMQKTRQLLDHLKQLQEFSKKKFGKKGLQRAYDLLTEVQNNKLQLVKPYTAIYYKDLSTALSNRYSTDPNAVKQGKFWLKNNYHKIVGNNVPNRYTNPKYKLIRSSPELSSFYDFFQKEVQEGYKQLPPWIDNKNDEKIPSLLKDVTFSFLDIAKNVKDKGILKSIWHGIRTILFGQGRVEMYDTDGELVTQAKHEDLTQDDIKMRMIGEISPDQKSADLGKVLQQWISFTQEFGEMYKVLPEVRMIQELSSAKQYQTANNPFRTDYIDGKNSTMYKAVNRYIDAKVLGNTSKKFGQMSFGEIYDNNGNAIGRESFYLSDMVETWIKYTRMLYLGLNPFSAVNNILIGYANDVVQASGNEFYTSKDLIRATKVYWGSKYDPESKYNKLEEYFQTLQELGEYEEARQVAIQSNFEKLQGKMFFMQQFGEEFVQGSTMIAYLQGQKVNTSQGEKSLWDLFSVENNKLKFDHTLAGFQFNNQELNKHREIIKKINRNVHGNYSSDNSSVFQPYVLFQAAMLFKKWIPQAIQTRFQAKRYDYITGTTTEGRFRTVANLITDKRAYSHLKGILTGYEAFKSRLNSDEKLKPHEIINMKKTLMDLALLCTFIISKGLLSPPKDDKDKVWYIPDYLEDNSIITLMGIDSEQGFREWKGPASFMYKSLMDQLNRGINDVSNFYNPSFYTGLTNMPMLKSAQAIYGVFESLLLDIEDIFVDVPDTSTHYKSGERRGERKDINKTLDAIPVLKQVNKARTTTSKSYKDITKY